MAWEYRHGKTKKYYYKSRKVNGKVVKNYYGCGRTAELFAIADAERKFIREQARIERERLDELDRQITEFCQVVDGIALGLLVSRGYYRHKGNHLDWRKRRDFMECMDLRILEETKMTLNTDGIDINDVRDNLQQLVQRGETGDANAVLALQPVVQDVAIYEHAIDMGKEVKSRLTQYMANGELAIQEALLAEMNVRKSAFLEAVAPTNPFERYLFDLLGEEMEICRIQSRHADVVDARHSPQEPQQKRQDRAHKRYQNVIRTTAQVYKALKGKPSLQVNLAQNQIVS
jgi:hypothetical protein